MSPIIKNAFYSSLTNALQSLANVLIVVLLARPLGTEEFGRLLLAISFAAIFAIIVEYGFRWYAVKEASQRPGEARDIAGEIFNAQLLLALGATFLAFAAASLLGYPPRTLAVIAVIWVSAVLVAFTQVTRSIFRGLDMFPSDTALNVVLFAAMALALAPPLIFRPTTIAFAAAILTARAAYFAAGLALFNKKIGRMAFHFDMGKGARLLAKTLAFGTQLMTYKLLLEWNTIVLHQFRGNSGVGIYQAAFRFVLATMLISDILLQAFFPVMARLAMSDRARFVKTSTVLSRYLLCGGAYLTGAFFVFAPELILAVFGPAYVPAVPILRVLAFAVLIYFSSTAPAVALVALGQQGKRARACLMVLVFNVLCSFVLIPALGALGAALAMLATFALLALLYSHFLHRAVHSVLIDRRSLYAGLLVLAGTFATLQLKAASLFLGLGAFVFLGALLFLAATTGGEKKEMLQALRSSFASSSGIDS